VQITGLLRFRQPFFLDITYTRRYLWWFLPGTFVCIVPWIVAAGLTLVRRLCESVWLAEW
jgi:hypothetical protein